MLTRDDLEKKTVVQLKDLCRKYKIRGYSKMKKRELVDAIFKLLQNQNEAGSSSGATQPAKKTQTRVVYSRAESEKRVEASPKLQERQKAEIERLQGLAKSSRAPAIETTPAKDEGGNQAAWAEKEPRGMKKPSTTRRKGRRKGRSSRTSRATQDSNVKQVAVKPMAETKPELAKAEPNITSETEPVAPPVTEPEPEPEPRFQDLPASEQQYILNKKLSKKALKILKMHKSDFQALKLKKIEKLLNILEHEKGKLVVYQRTDKLLRDFIDESIALINLVREEMLNEIERHYIENILPKILEKNRSKVSEIIARIDKYYTELDAARDIVDSLKFSPAPPFRAGYLATIIADKIKSKEIS
ncbi:MAG: Rho termination factor N-terminal domain-containing protein [Promethearchaeota archaeon]